MRVVMTPTGLHHQVVFAANEVGLLLITKSTMREINHHCLVTAMMVMIEPQPDQNSYPVMLLRPVT